MSIFCKLGVDGFLGTIVMFILMFFSQIAGVILVDKVNQPLALCRHNYINPYVFTWDGGEACSAISIPNKLQCHCLKIDMLLYPGGSLVPRLPQFFNIENWG